MALEERIMREAHSYIMDNLRRILRESGVWYEPGSVVATWFRVERERSGVYRAVFAVYLQGGHVVEVTVHYSGRGERLGERAVVRSCGGG